MRIVQSERQYTARDYRKLRRKSCTVVMEELERRNEMDFTVFIAFTKHESIHFSVPNIDLLKKPELHETIAKYFELKSVQAYLVFFDGFMLQVTDAEMLFSIYVTPRDSHFSAYEVLRTPKGKIKDFLKYDTTKLSMKEHLLCNLITPASAGGYYRPPDMVAEYENMVAKLW